MTETSEVLDAVARDVKQISHDIETAHDLLRAAQDAGETTATYEAQLRSLETRREKWARMLRSRGYDL